MQYFLLPSEVYNLLHSLFTPNYALLNALDVSVLLLLLQPAM